MATYSPHYLPRSTHASHRLRLALTAGLGVTIWLAAVGTVMYQLSVPTKLGWLSALGVVVVSAGSVLVVWATTRLRRELRVRSAVTDSILNRRIFGTLDLPESGAPRSLRPLGMSVGQAATCTGVLLTELLNDPAVRLFRGVNAPGAEPSTHVVVAGRQVVLVESVAWPAGRYHVDRDGRVHCDGVPIGQSVRPLLDAVAYWREVLPRHQRVTAVVIVHPSGDGQVVLPAGTGDLTLVRAREAVGLIRNRLPRRGQVSRHVLAALVTAVR
jgi:hypothetical protein